MKLFVLVQENEEMFSSLARFAIVALANCATPVNPKAAPAYSIAMLQTGVAHVVWSSLFCAGGVLKNLIAVSKRVKMIKFCLNNLNKIRHASKVSVELVFESNTTYAYFLTEVISSAVWLQRMVMVFLRYFKVFGFNW